MLQDETINLLDIHHTIIRNGRVDIMGNVNAPRYPLFRSGTTDYDFSRHAVSSMFEYNTLQEIYFSTQNISLLQDLIIKNVYEQSNKKHMIGPQNETNLKIIMRSYYLQYGKNLNTHIKEQVKTLNDFVLDFSVREVLSNISMYMSYKEKVSSLPPPLMRPVYVTNSGTKTNMNYIY